MLGTYCGTSWEGTQWVSRGDLRTQFRWGLDARLGSMLVSLTLPAVVALTVLFFAAPAYAHGTTCYADAWKPFPQNGRIYAKNVISCRASGYWHRIGIKIYKNINNWPDAPVGTTEASTPAANDYIWTNGAPRGCGVYYSTGWVKGHNYDRSNRNYYRC